MFFAGEKIRVLGERKRWCKQRLRWSAKLTLNIIQIRKSCGEEQSWVEARCGARFCLVTPWFNRVMVKIYLCVDALTTIGQPELVLEPKLDRGTGIYLAIQGELEPRR